MKTAYRKYIKYLFMGITAALIATYFMPRQKTETSPRDYKDILQSGILRAVTEYNSLSFYVDGDSISGFHHDLIQEFAKEKGLCVEIIPEMSFEKRIAGLEEGKYDIIADNVLVTAQTKDSILFTRPITLHKQILIQRKLITEEDSMFIRSQLDLAQRTLHVIKGSPAILRIHNLSNEIGDTIYIKEVEKYGPEQLLAMVAHGDINYAVCDESLAIASIDSFPQLDITTDISFTQFYSWGVNKHSPLLLDSLNAWLESFVKSDKYRQIYRKYYKD